MADLLKNFMGGGSETPAAQAGDSGEFDETCPTLRDSF